MKETGLAVISGLFLGLAGCAGTKSDAPTAGSGRDASMAWKGPKAAAQPWERDAYTRTSEVLIDGALVGYLVAYEPIPAGERIERALPIGSYRIQGLHFEDVGFVTPRGEVYRFTRDGSESLGIWRLEEGLRRFYGSKSRTTLHELQPPPPPKAPVKDDAKGDGKEGDAGEEKKADEAGKGH